MTKVTADMSVSVDGFAVGLNQSAENPFGEGVGMRLHRWMFEAAEANAAERAAIVEAKAYVMGRNMFGPGRGDWDLDWTGWWGEDPPYHAPVFVLTHHPREPIDDGGRHDLPLRHRRDRVGAGRRRARPRATATSRSPAERRQSASTWRRG